MQPLYHSAFIAGDGWMKTEDGIMMDKTDIKYTTYVQILREELIPAMGCTEPIALAYAAAKAREVLGLIPDRVLIQVSGSIIKNVKSVIVPNTHHLKGIPAAAAAGIIAGRPEKELEVISSVSDVEVSLMNGFLDKAVFEVEHIDNGYVFEINVTLFRDDSYAKVRIVNYHTNIVLIEKNGNVIFEKEIEDNDDKPDRADRSLLDMESIWEFVNSVDPEDVREVLERQISYNMAIAEEGIRGNYGANIGSVLLDTYGDDIRVRAKAMAAAGSDARMNGCELPVIINSGSGNQGITCSVPVIEYAREFGANHETLLRALVLSNLTAIHQKTGIGTLSAYCGAVSAGAGAGAGIAYLCGGGYEEVIHTVVNSLAIVSGIVCDGAKASCAAKIASSVDAAILGYNMYKRGQEFKGGDGIVMNDIESTIRGIGYLGREGMKKTNEEIIKLMVGE
jgi:L-cysteine desulfidase